MFGLRFELTRDLGFSVLACSCAESMLDMFCCLQRCSQLWLVGFVMVAARNSRVGIRKYHLDRVWSIGHINRGDRCAKVKFTVMNSLRITF